MRKQLYINEIGIGSGYENVIYYSMSEADKEKFLWSPAIDALVVIRLINGIPFTTHA